MKLCYVYTSQHFVLNNFLGYLCLQRALQKRKRVVLFQPFNDLLESIQHKAQNQLRTVSKPAAMHASTEKGKSKVANSSLCVKTA